MMRYCDSLASPLDFQVQIPGKTFLFGEYAVLQGGAAVGLATAPVFKLNLSKKSFGLDSEFHFHSESAAGLLFKKNNIHLDDIFICVENPYQAGGFGLSTAEFIAAWLWINRLKDGKSFQQSGLSVDLESFQQIGLFDDPETVMQIFTEYLNLYVHKKNEKPSGVDLLTQIRGPVLAYRSPEDLESMVWPFQNYGFLIFSTGLKVKTHEHLQSLDRSVLKQLVPTAQFLMHDFQNNNEEAFLEGLQKWKSQLDHMGLIHPEVKKMMAQIQQLEGVLQAKACGALGADVFIVFCALEAQNRVKNAIQELGYRWQADHLSLVNPFDKNPGIC